MLRLLEMRLGALTCLRLQHSQRLTAISVVFSILPKEQELNHLESDQPRNLEYSGKVPKISVVENHLAFLAILK